ncbi:carcinoembryonic antigen-related cell adhesion molecule 1 [Xenopus laevis]|uniref:Carcinoembryonic antigen-related cell adhesion molecule 1 n=2 Tax=Xenopus laevis TaxID=8355 RepID=A0A1L8FN84_XENLA|nr:carcinoembryonic antigen-related cell adhesion molecule 1 [Xenopus laevis]OCT73021.1 hypothetical protein XELAEV_18036000mg [Xenopus laevis]
MGPCNLLLLLVTAIGSVSCLQNVSRNESESVIFTVKLNLPAQNQRLVTWRFGTSTIATAIQGNTPTYSNSCTDRCSLYGNASLQLDNVTRADTGNYTLTVTNIDTTVQQTEQFHLTVYGPLTPPNLTVTNPTNGNPYLVNDTNVTLQCDSGGQNVVNYIFYKDENITACSQPQVTCDKDFLYFQPITMSDTGRYTCKIENPVGSNTSQPLSLTVIGRVSVTLSSNASSGLLRAGKDSVNLTCSSLGINVTFSWYLDGAPLPPNPRYHLMNSNSSLIISPVERTDNGSFTCIGSNFVNNDTSKPLNLNLTWTPDGDIQCIADKKDKNVTLSCSWEGGKPAAHVTLAFKNINKTELEKVSEIVSEANVSNTDSMLCNGSQLEHQFCMLLLDVPQGITKPPEALEQGRPAILSVTLNSNKMRASSSTHILPATFSWFDPREQSLSNVDGYSINSSDSSSKLEIHSLKPIDNGTFICVATNIMGNYTFKFEVKVPQVEGGGGGSPLSAGAIAGIVIGSLAGVALIAVAVFFIVKSTKKKQTNGSSGNPQMNLTEVPNKKQEDEEYVKYADLRFKNTNPSNKAETQQVPETEYSTVKR